MNPALAVSLKGAIPLLLGVVGTFAATMAPGYHAAVCSPLSSIIGG